MIASTPHAAAAAAQKAAPLPQRSSALDAAGYAYALVRANDGGAVVTLDLDRTQRVRSAVYLYETRAQADAVRKAVMSARPKAAPLALAKVPLGEAAALVLAPPAKREGVPGYFCHRLLVEQSRLAAARKITGISDLGDRFLPLFYVDDCVEIKQCVGCTREFFTKSFLGDDAAVLARSSGEEPASPRHRAGVASMVWRPTRRFSTNAP